MRDRNARSRDEEVVGLPGFEPGSIGPKPTSIDQTNPQAPKKTHGIGMKNFARAISKIFGHFNQHPFQSSAWPIRNSVETSSEPDDLSSDTKESIVNVPSWSVDLFIAEISKLFFRHSCYLSFYEISFCFFLH